MPASTRRATGYRKFRKRILGTEIGDNTKQFSGRTKQDPAKRKILFSFLCLGYPKSGMSCKKRSGKPRSPDNGSTGLPAVHLWLVYQMKPDSTLTARAESGLQPEVRRHAVTRNPAAHFTKLVRALQPEVRRHAVTEERPRLARDQRAHVIEERLGHAEAVLRNVFVRHRADLCRNQ